jgi:hypothetical protein
MCLPGSSVSEVGMPSIDKSDTQILNSRNMCYIPFERAKRALSNAIYSFLWELILLLKSDKKKRLSFFLDAFQPKVTQKEC